MGAVYVRCCGKSGLLEIRPRGPLLTQMYGPAAFRNSLATEGDTGFGRFPFSFKRPFPADWIDSLNDRIFNTVMIHSPASYPFVMIGDHCQDALFGTPPVPLATGSYDPLAPGKMRMRRQAYPVACPPSRLPFARAPDRDVCALALRSIPARPAAELPPTAAAYRVGFQPT